MKTKSIAANAALNAIKSICTIIFPLITFPYVSRVLQVENLGIYNFCTSIISYVTLFASLGVNTYAVREGARKRENQNALSQFASEVFTINVISTIIAYSAFFLLLALVPQLQEKSIILLILSISVFFQTIGCEWVFNIYEDFGYITIRSIVFQILSMVLLFMFVHSDNDLIVYSIITVVANSGANLINAFARRKYCKIKLVFNKSILVRIAPIFILFANTLATNIYINSDMTMVGLFAGDYYTGLYSVSTKLYFIVKNLLSAIIIVSVPRLSAYLGNKDRDGYLVTARGILNALMVLVTPVVVGMFSISENIVFIIAGEEYIPATRSLQLLSIALLFCLFSWFYTSCVLIPHKQDKKVLTATLIAAVSNVVFNLFLIPLWKHDAAALTTVIAELTSLLICFVYSREYFRSSVNKRDLITIVVGNASIVGLCLCINNLIESLFIAALVSVAASVLAYYLILKIGKNSAVDYVGTIIKGKLRRH